VWVVIVRRSNYVRLAESIDPTAFSGARAVASPADFVDDDVPYNLSYLNKPSRSHRRTGSTKKQASAATERLWDQFEPETISDIDGETIRMLEPTGLVIVEDYLSCSREEDKIGPKYVFFFFFDFRFARMFL
jgi:autophagy-related protein 2